MESPGAGPEVIESPPDGLLSFGAFPPGDLSLGGDELADGDEETEERTKPPRVEEDLAPDRSSDYGHATED